LWENYPTVVLEAMAAGATVVAADRGGIPEMVKNNITGMLFDALNPYKLSMIVNELLVDETKRLMLAKNARQELIDKIYDEHYEKELLNVYTNYEKKETTL
jgi:glycosyltransferase involved in cell wall biosynthesis